MTISRHRIATASSVSRTLGSYELDGDLLSKSYIRKTPEGEEEVGGFKVSRGEPNVIPVQYIPPDSLDEDLIEETRNFFLNLYTEILEGQGYIVEPKGTILIVSRSYQYT